MLKRILTENKTLLLGRWEHRITDKQKEIKFVLTNLDHCGDSICGKPKPINNIIKDTDICKPKNDSTKVE